MSNSVGITRVMGVNTMNTVKLSELVKYNPCVDGVSELIGRDVESLEDLTSNELNTEYDYQHCRTSYILWSVSHCMPHGRQICVDVAVYAAELVLPIYECECPNDSRPRKAIEAARTAANVAQAACAAQEACAAADVALAANAAFAAAQAAWAAARTAYADAAAAVDAAIHAAGATRAAANAAGDAAQDKIKKYLLESIRNS